MRAIREILSNRLCVLLCALSSATADVWSDDFENGIQPMDTCELCCYPSSLFPITGDASVGFDHFRSLPEGSWEDNTGAFASINLAMPVPILSCYGFGVQLGGSYGIYDWLGRGSALEGNQKEVQQQGFLTAAVFRRTLYDSGINMAIGYDGMFNKNFGVFALDPYFSQVRYAASYLFCYRDEFGFWGTVHTDTSHKSTVGFPVAFRSINQINLFWTHFFYCAQTTIWGGIPYGRSLMFPSERQGKYLFGASFRVSLTDRWSIDGHASYMQAPHTGDVDESRNYASNICFGLNYSFGDSRCCSSFSPYLPIANNSNFLADTSLNY